MISYDTPAHINFELTDFILNTSRGLNHTNALLFCREGDVCSVGRENVIAIEDIRCRLASAQGVFDPEGDMMRGVPLDRWDPESVHGASVGGRFGGYVEDWANFDANAFNISPSEAAFMDPAQRVLLEVSYFSSFVYYHFESWFCILIWNE